MTFECILAVDKGTRIMRVAVLDNIHHMFEGLEGVQRLRAHSSVSTRSTEAASIVAP